jgi:lipoprotein-releasing system permease protein
LSVEKFIADKISGSDKGTASISKPIVKIAIIGIVLGVAVMILTISIVLGFKKVITNKITGLTTDIAITSIGMNPSNEQDPISIGSDTMLMVRKLPFVKHIQPTAYKSGILKTKNENEGILLKGIDESYDFTFLKEHLLEGKLLSFSDSATSKEILISKNLSDRLGLKVGEKMLIYFIVQREIRDSLSDDIYVKSEHRSRKLSISGIFKTDFTEFDNNLAFVDLKQIQKLNYWSASMAGSYEVKLLDFNSLETAKDELEDVLGYFYAVSSIKQLYANIFIWLEKLDINGIIIVVLMILVAVINMITALLILILERASMVGLVKSLGMSNTGVRKIFFYISLKLIGKGLLWGNIVGIGLCYLQYYFKIMKLDGATYYVDYVAVEINWIAILMLNAGTFIVCSLMLLLPSIIITKLTPIKTLRFD